MDTWDKLYNTVIQPTLVRAIPTLVTILLIMLGIWATGQQIRDGIMDFLKEFIDLAQKKITARALNAILMICIVIALVTIFFLGYEMTGSQTSQFTSDQTLIQEGIFLSYFFFFCICAMLSVLWTRDR